MFEYFLYMATGVFVGIASGLLGVGGGIIIVPILYFVFTSQGHPQAHVMHMALATSLATIIITSVSSVVAHHRKEAVLWPVVVRITPGICIGAWLGGISASQLTTGFLKPAFGAFELLVALYMLSNYRPAGHNQSLNTPKAFGGGLFIGSVSALAGIGGGTMTVPFLSWHNVAIKNAVATSAAIGLPIAVMATTAYVYSSWSIPDLPPWTLGYVHLIAFVFIIATSIATAPLGAMLAHRLPDALLKKVFAFFILAAGLKMITG